MKTILKEVAFNLKFFQKLERTRTTLFLGPMLDPIIKSTKEKFGFLNIYLGDSIRPQEKEALYVLYNPIFTKAYDKFEKQLTTHSDYQGNYDAMPGLVMHVFSIPPCHKEDYHQYLLGNYTKFNNSYKLNFKKGTNLHKIVHGQIKYPVWDKQLEIFNLNQITYKNGK